MNSELDVSHVLPWCAATACPERGCWGAEITLETTYAGDGLHLGKHCACGFMDDDLELSSAAVGVLLEEVLGAEAEPITAAGVLSLIFDKIVGDAESNLEQQVWDSGCS